MPQAKIVTKSRRAPCSCPKKRKHLLQTDPSDLILTACSAAILPQKSSFRAFFIFFRVFKKNPFRQIHPTPQRKTHTSTILSFLHIIQMYFLQNKSCPIIRADTIKPKGLPSQRQQYQSKHDHRKNGESAIAHASFKFIRHPYENSILIIIIFNGKISLPHHSERLHLSQTYSLFITAC